MVITPIDFDEACAFVTQKHRHHPKPQGCKFCLGLAVDGRIVGVCIVGRPVNKHLQRGGYTLEVTRLCTDGTPNACSKLYAADFRAAVALGYHRLITYILISETGASLRGAGWRLVKQTRGGRWDTPARPRVDKHPTQRKLRFEKVL